MNTTLTVWSISVGDRLNSCSFTADFQAWCRSVGHISFQAYSCAEAMCRMSTNAERPDLILINSRRRGEFSRKMLQRVVATYPLSLISEITGEWCIGDTRSGQPLPIACRLSTSIAHRRLQSMLTSRLHFLQMRAALNPVTSSSELPSFWNENTTRAHCKTVNVVASDRCERFALQTLLFQEGFNVELYSNHSEIAEGNKCWPCVYCFGNRRELVASLREVICWPAVIIASHLNGHDRTCFADKCDVAFVRKPFFSHDLVNAITSVCEVSNVDAA